MEERSDYNPRNDYRPPKDMGNYVFFVLVIFTAVVVTLALNPDLIRRIPDIFYRH